MDKDSLRSLILLQEKEERFFRLLEEKGKILKEIQHFEQELSNVLKEVENINKEKENIKKLIEELLKTIEKHEKNLKKITQSLRTIKSKELYKNVLREKSKTENAIINTKNRLKQAYIELSNIENSNELKDLLLKQKRLQEEIRNLKEDLESIEQSILKAEKDIKDYKDTLEKSLIDFYEDIKKRVQPVFVPIDNKACSYCGTILPIDFYNRLIQNNITSFMCPNCQRIIYKQYDIIK